MVLSIKPAYRGVAVGATAGALLVGGFALGTTRGIAASAATTGRAAGQGAQLTASSGSARITVTGTGTVTGTPGQLVLSMGAAASAGSVTGALRQGGPGGETGAGARRRGGG